MALVTTITDPFPHYRARYYDPNTGRFIQADPFPGEIGNPTTLINKYSYTGNNSINRTDPSGLIFGIDDLLFIGLASLIGGLIEGFSHGFTLQNFLSGVLKGLGIGASIIGASSILGAGGGFFSSIGTKISPFLGGYLGLLNPGLWAEISAAVLSLPAIAGLFNPDAPSWTRTYANIFLTVGSVGNLAKALALTKFIPAKPGAAIPTGGSVLDGFVSSIDATVRGSMNMLDNVVNQLIARQLFLGGASLLPLGL